VTCVAAWWYTAMAEHSLNCRAGCGNA